MKYNINYFLNLLKDKKLVLICDMDETFISCLRLNLINIPYHANITYPCINFQQHNKHYEYCIQIRPYLDHFLSRMNELFELHLMSAGSKPYIKQCLKLIDPYQKYFKNRIVTQEQLFNQIDKYQTKNQMFPECNNMILAIDDRLDVWSNCSTVLQIKPFNFFSKIEDILKMTSSQNDSNIKDQITQHLFQTDTDDNYLLTLKSVFEEIHSEFFEELDKMRSVIDESKYLPDVTNIIKRKRLDILKDEIIYNANSNFNLNLNYNGLSVSELIEIMGGEESKTLSSSVTYIIDGNRSDFTQTFENNVTFEWLLESYYRWKTGDKRKYVCELKRI